MQPAKRIFLAPSSEASQAGAAAAAAPSARLTSWVPTSTMLGLKEGQMSYEVPRLSSPQMRASVQRQDGILWPEGKPSPAEPERYGDTWRNRQEERKKILESDPNYKFLMLVAGHANMRVTEVYDEGDLDSAEKRSLMLSEKSRLAENAAARRRERINDLARQEAEFVALEGASADSPEMSGDFILYQSIFDRAYFWGTLRGHDASLAKMLAPLNAARAQAEQSDDGSSSISQADLSQVAGFFYSSLASCLDGLSGVGGVGEATKRALMVVDSPEITFSSVFGPNRVKKIGGMPSYVVGKRGIPLGGPFWDSVGYAGAGSLARYGGPETISAAVKQFYYDADKAASGAQDGTAGARDAEIDIMSDHMCALLWLVIKYRYQAASFASRRIDAADRDALNERMPRLSQAADDILGASSRDNDDEVDGGDGMAIASSFADVDESASARRAEAAVVAGAREAAAAIFAGDTNAFSSIYGRMLQSQDVLADSAQEERDKEILARVIEDASKRHANIKPLADSIKKASEALGAAVKIKAERVVGLSPDPAGALGADPGVSSRAAVWSDLLEAYFRHVIMPVALAPSPGGYYDRRTHFIPFHSKLASGQASSSPQRLNGLLKQEFANAATVYHDALHKYTGFSNADERRAFNRKELVEWPLGLVPLAVLPLFESFKHLRASHAINRLHASKELDKIRKELESYARLAREQAAPGGGSIKGTDYELPYEHTAAWMSAPENSGTLRIQPWVASAIKSATDKVRAHVPGIFTVSSAREGYITSETLQHSPAVQGVFAELVASQILLQNFEAPRQYNLQILGRYHIKKETDAIIALRRLVPSLHFDRTSRLLTLRRASFF